MYFPPGALEPPTSIERWNRERLYVDVIGAMQEPSLYCMVTESETIRLTRLEWTGVPIAIRVTRNDSGATVHSVKLEAPTWNLPPGNIVERHSAMLTERDVQSLMAALDNAGFWSMPTFEDRRGVDGPGTAWIIEGRVNGRYHVVNRASPPPGAYRTAGELMLRLAGVTEAELGANAPGLKIRPDRTQPGQSPPPPASDPKDPRRDR